MVSGELCEICKVKVCCRLPAVVACGGNGNTSAANRRAILNPDAKASRSDTEFISSVVSQYFSSFSFCSSDGLSSSSDLLRDCRCCSSL